MADISNFKTQILEAEKGETVRDAIVSALKTMRDFGINAQTLQGTTPDKLATVEMVRKAFLTTHKMNSKPVFLDKIDKTSNKAVESGVIYDAYTTINRKFGELLGGE